MLRESLDIRRLGWTVLLFGAIVSAGFLGDGVSSGNAGLSRSALFIFLGMPLGVGVPAHRV